MRIKNCRVLLSQDANITQTFHGADAYDTHGRYWSYYHGGIDLVKYDHYLDYITAHTAGTVVGIRTNCTGFEEGGSYGNYVLLKHKNGYQTMYAHLAYGTTRVQLGEKVKKGQILAYMDNTGTSYGGHLHFEIRTKNGVRIDPEPYLDEDLPGMKKVTFMAYDINKKKWLPEVKNGSIGVRTAGNAGHKMGAFSLKCSGLDGYYAFRHHKWGKKITGYGTEQGDYAGSKRYVTRAVAISGKDIAYKVQFMDGSWSPTKYGRNCNLEDPDKGYAGDKRHKICQIMIWKC